MEIGNAASVKNRISSLFLKDSLPFTKKRDLNWSAIKVIAGAGVGVTVLVLLLLPTPKEEQKNFHEKIEPGSGAVISTNDNTATQDTLAQLQGARTNVNTVPRSLDGLYQSGAVGGAPINGPDRNSTMILGRQGADSRNQLPPSIRISVRLTEKAILGTQAMPVIGVVLHDVSHEDNVAIPEGATLYGEASFDDSSERARIDWKSVRFPDGRERQISAIGVGSDGQAGVDGNLHSEAIKNAVGQTVTRFIGAYAEGSMQKGSFGASQGGSDNGLKNAVAETAKDRADAWAEDMKKEKKWIELQAGVELTAVLTQPFLFRDPGAVYGR